MDMSFCQPEWNFDPAFPQLANVCFKRKFRFKLIIPSVSASGANSLPPSKAARPNLTFKEGAYEHLNETISFPIKPEWKPLQLTLYDISKGAENPVFTWMRRQYDPKKVYCSYWKPALSNPVFKIAEISLIMLDGCGEVIEEWIYEGVYPMVGEFGDLDYADSSVCYVDVSLRYDRAYINYPSFIDLDLPSIITDLNCGVSSVPSVTPSFIPFMDIESLNPPDFKQMRF